ncbi:MAG: peptidase [Tissierellia bacterium]|nr:peptidase [Tissierellia bacterium]
MPNNPWYNSQITPRAAVEIALQRVPGQVIEVELDTKSDGRLIYEVEIRTNSGVYEVKINAITGEIIKVELD